MFLKIFHTEVSIEYILKETDTEIYTELYKKERNNNYEITIKISNFN